jgi:hypothetical protein
VQSFISILIHKYKSKHLPGLPQIERGHFAALDWNEIAYINSDNWDLVVKGGPGIKLAFVMGTWHGLPAGKCIRCYKPRGRKTAGRRYTKWRVEILDLIWFQTDK